jgi:hypothetical protein
MLRCTWCCRDTETNPCQHCGNTDTVMDPSQPHRADWSRKNIKEMECKVCDRVVSNRDYFAGTVENQCPGV